jgi:hypothetical protein
MSCRSADDGLRPPPLQTAQWLLRTLAPFLGMLAASGCVATQVSNNTVDLAGTIHKIQYQQTLTNLGNFAAERFSIPSEAYLTAGTVQIVNSVSPSVTFPFSHMFAQTF